MRTIRLITCNDAFQAQVIQGALEHEGIASVLHNVNTSNVLRGFDQSISGVDIFVYEDEYDKALALLSMLAAAPPGTEHWEYMCNRCRAHFDKPVARKSEN